MQPGCIVIYREQGRLALGVVDRLVAGKDTAALELLSETDRKLSLTRDRIFFQSPWRLPRELPSRDRRRRLQELRTQIETCARAVDLKELWELLHADAARVFGWQELAEFVVSGDRPLERAGVLAALWSQSVYFKERRAGSFSPRDANSVEAKLRQQRQEQERIRARHAFLAWVTARLDRSGSPMSTQLPDQVEPPTDGKPFLSLIQGLALYGEGYDKRSEALKLLNQTGFEGRGQPWHVAFELLVRLGIWETDQELSLLRYHIPTRFSDQALQTATALPEFSVSRGGRDDNPPFEDLTGLDAVTIDDAETNEIDDALSLTRQNGTFLIGIHIADAGYYVQPNSVLDKSALARGTSIYLPSGSFPMLPLAIGQEKASLRAGTLRPALSFFVEVDARGELRPQRITRSVVRVTRRLSYEKADHALLDDATGDAALLHDLARLCHKRRARRVAQGAILIDGDEIKVKAVDGHISTSLLSGASPARGLVSECMIMANETAARYCHTHALPALYSGQAPPDEALPGRSDLPTRRSYVHAARRLMNPAQLGTVPEAHSALGLPVYTQATSPLRRYTDLQIHHQIKHHLAVGTPLFSASQLQVVAASVQAAIADARRCERESTRYWLLRLLESRCGETVHGEVVRTQHRRLLVELNDTLLVVPINSAPALPLGTPVQVRIVSADARQDRLSVRLVDARP